MKLAWGIVGSVVVLAGLSGLNVNAVGEYAQVLRNRTSHAIDKAIPLSVEIDRMEVLLEKLNRQVTSQKYDVAKAKVALEDANTKWESNQLDCARSVSNMRKLRSATSTVSSGCGTTVNVSQPVASGNVHRALQQALATYKVKQAACKAQRDVIRQQQQAYGQLEERFAAWQNDRALLKQRLETLRVRYQAQQLASNTDTTVFDDADLARATELADKIERELRITEAQQRLDASPIDAIKEGTTSIEAQQIEAEVDSILIERGV